MKRIVIIDGNSLINRAYYAMQRPMITSEGIYTQGIYGFLNMLGKILDDYSPEYMVVAWDRKHPTFRHEQYKDYKAGRKKMPIELAMELPIMKEILEAMSISNLEIDGFEADDIIGTVSRVAEEEGISPLIITGDKDALQLSSDVTKVLITKRGITDFEIYDREKMQEVYELTPEQFIDLKALMGDKSDNIPGISGVGEKTGIKLLHQFGTIAKMLANTDEIKNAKLREKVEDNIQLVSMSRKLVEIYRYVPLEFEISDFERVTPDYKRLIDIFVKLEFNSFLKKLKINTADLEISEEDSGEKAIELKEEITVSSEGDLSILDEIVPGQSVSIKVFTDANHKDRPQISAISLIAGEKYIYISSDESIMDKAVEILNSKNLKFLGHDLIRDYYALMSHGLKSFDTDFDTAVAQYILDPSKSNYSIKTLVFERFHREFEDEDEFLKDNGQMDLLGGSTKKEFDYGREWCKNVLALKDVQIPELESKELMEVLNKAELPLIEVLADMEVRGVTVSRDILREFGDELTSEIKLLEKQIYILAGEEFNINSPLQLGNILFEKLELPAGKKTKRGYSTSADILEKLRSKHPIVDLVLRYRTLSKLNSTYVEGLIPLIGTDGRIHAHFQQTVTATGRLSCTEPNLQNIPIRNEYGRMLRKAFVPEENAVLVGADYSQIELRVLAHLSGDENLIEAFNNGDDIHRNTASRVFNVPYEEVTALDRSRAKAVNFGVIYGMSNFGLSEELHITRKQAENYIQDYFDKHQAVKDYMDGQVNFCSENGYTKTILGRRRNIHEINSSKFMVKELGKRLAMNSPIQGSAADIIKLAMIDVYRELKEKNYKSKLILQVHDELIIETVKEEEEEVKELLVRNMTNAMELKVKLESDLNTGSSWYDLK